MKRYFCIECKKEKSAYGVRCGSCANRKKWSNSSYRQHMSDAHKGYIPTNLAQLHIMAIGNKYAVGRIPWNKGKIQESIRDEKHYLWKGDKASYRTKHHWVETRLGKANHCSFNSDHESTRYHWANISGKYTRNRSDWKRLCSKCHGEFDKVKRKK